MPKCVDFPRPIMKRNSYEITETKEGRDNMMNIIFGIIVTAVLIVGGYVLSVEISNANKEKVIVDYDYKDYKL